jgi:hypothetical protein
MNEWVTGIRLQSLHISFAICINSIQRLQKKNSPILINHIIFRYKIKIIYLAIHRPQFVCLNDRFVLCRHQIWFVLTQPGLCTSCVNFFFLFLSALLHLFYFIFKKINNSLYFNKLKSDLFPILRYGLTCLF